ncbi:hypothetical protein BU25DRAFT_486964 [Macroventuria anomochaeta]|uniref:Uncharacterized protein n=1 Tax=Macroventuria anomochaeta TaxID=301207 RepID=A0ACB6SIW2_9PLEO|nr:uncharacterized protein BU25DRAFT_486964 [Macroventuria anomochaeta]KAF2633988.1 hypothetical protein BU25DRAFT_486964 [Macroventuria anomochaeta]
MAKLSRGKENAPAPNPKDMTPPGRTAIQAIKASWDIDKITDIFRSCSKEVRTKLQQLPEPNDDFFENDTLDVLQQLTDMTKDKKDAVQKRLKKGWWARTNLVRMLTTHLHHGQGLLVIKKSDFFHLFWKAWMSIAPLQPNVILQQFARPTPEGSDSKNSSSSVYSVKDWLKTETLLRKVAKDKGSRELKKIRRSLHHISVQNSGLHHEIVGLKEVLKAQKKHKKKSKPLELQHHKDYHGGDEFYSPSRVEKARSRERAKQQEQKAEELKKAEMAELRHFNKLYKEKVVQERREQKLREKEARDRLKAEKAKEVAKRKAKREHQRNERNTKKNLYNYSKEASAWSQRLQHPERSRIVVVQLPVVVLLPRLAPHPLW